MGQGEGGKAMKVHEAAFFPHESEICVWVNTEDNAG